MKSNFHIAQLSNHSNNFLNSEPPSPRMSTSDQLIATGRQNRIDCIRRSDPPTGEYINLNALIESEDRTPEQKKIDDLWRNTQHNCFQYAISGIDRLPRESLQYLALPLLAEACDPVILHNNLEKMGLKWVTGQHGKPCSAPEGYYTIAAFTDPGIGSNSDYHFYRLDKDGSWSHKLNNFGVSRLDSRGNKIDNPRMCSTDYRRTIINGFYGSKYYVDFVGYFYVPNAGLFKK